MQDLSRGANDFNGAMIKTAVCGHEDIVSLMLDLGADNYNEVLSIILRNGHQNIVELILERMN